MQSQTSPGGNSARKARWGLRLDFDSDGRPPLVGLHRGASIAPRRSESAWPSSSSAFAVRPSSGPRRKRAGGSPSSPRISQPPSWPPSAVSPRSGSGPLSGSSSSWASSPSSRPRSIRFARSLVRGETLARSNAPRSAPGSPSSPSGDRCRSLGESWSLPASRVLGPLVAVILGVCLRCSWLRPGEGFSFSGRVSCSWLARRFRLSLRAIQGAKDHLSEIGWLIRSGNITTSGELVSINPALAPARRPSMRACPR